MGDEEETGRLRALTAERRERAEEAAEEARDPTEEHAHVRRADRAAYLEDKLAERERSEREG